MATVTLLDRYSLSQRFRKFARSIRYRYSETHRQRVLGPPNDVEYNAECKGSEVFVSAIPTLTFFETLFPLFQRCGRIYQIRIMLSQDLSKCNGLAYVSYFSEDGANQAIRRLNFYEIAPGARIKVHRSFDNKRLYVGNIPQNKLRDQIWRELISHGMHGIVDVITYRSYSNPSYNRGFAFVEFETHKLAAEMVLKFQGLKLFSKSVTLDWSVPLVEVSDQEMQKSCKLFMRNLPLIWDAAGIEQMVKKIVSPRKVLRVHKFKDYSFIHFHNRADAEIALSLLRVQFSGSDVEVEWGKPQSVMNSPQYRNKKIGELITRRQQQMQQREGIPSTVYTANSCCVHQITNSMISLRVNDVVINKLPWESRGI